jgi:DNA polymerase-4
VRQEVGLGVSVGLAGNCMMARLASASAKPGGVVWVPPGQEEQFLADLPVRKLFGVGSTTEAKLHDMNIHTVADLRAIGLSMLRAMFGRRGELLYERCRGQDHRPIRRSLMPKSISRETTFHVPTRDPHVIRGMLFYLLERAMRTARKAGLLAGGAELTIRYDDFKQLAASRLLPRPSESEDEVFAVVLELLNQLDRRRVALRFVGVALSSFSRAVPGRGERKLFEAAQEIRDRRLHGAVDAIRDRYGHAALVAGTSIELLGQLQQNEYGFILRTPSLTK